MKYAEGYALDIKKANEELDEANSQVAALKPETSARASETAEATARAAEAAETSAKALDYQLKAEKSARAAEAAHSGAVKLVEKRLETRMAFANKNKHCERDRSRSPIGAYARQCQR